MRSLFHALAPLMMSCLVTDKIELPEERNFPPSIVSAPEAPGLGVALDQIIQVDLDDPESPTQITIPVIVRDPNVDQELEFQFYLDFVGNPSASELPQDEDVSLAPTGEVERSLNLRVQTSRLSVGCHQLELLVTSEFDGGIRFREPVTSGDIDQAVWWVRVIDDVNTSVDLGSCI